MKTTETFIKRKLYHSVTVTRNSRTPECIIGEKQSDMKKLSMAKRREGISKISRA